MRVLIAFVLLVLFAATCAAADRPTEERQLLLMLRVPPPHFRPDAYAAGSYESAPGREARRRIARTLARNHDLHLIDDWPMPALGLDCFVLEATTDESSRRAVELLAADPRVESVQPMQLFRTLGAGDPLSAAQPAVADWHLRELHTLATGRNVTVASLDTGVDTTHPDLRGQVALTRNFVDAGTMPVEKHGTEIAGILVARADNGIGIAGIAPHARLLALRACWLPARENSAAICSSFTLAKALQFALAQRADVFNLSLSGPPDRLLARLLDTALQQGVIVVGAVDKHATDGGFPATHPGVFAVADSREGAFVRSLLTRALVVEQVTKADRERIAEILEGYADNPIGYVDASVIAIAERLGEEMIATLDRRDFAVARPRHVEAFTLLP